MYVRIFNPVERIFGIFRKLPLLLVCISCFWKRVCWSSQNRTRYASDYY